MTVSASIFLLLALMLNIMNYISPLYDFKIRPLFHHQVCRRLVLLLLIILACDFSGYMRTVSSTCIKSCSFHCADGYWLSELEKAKDLVLSFGELFMGSFLLFIVHN